MSVKDKFYTAIYKWKAQVFYYLHNKKISVSLEEEKYFYVSIFFEQVCNSKDKGFTDEGKIIPDERRGPFDIGVTLNRDFLRRDQRGGCVQETITARLRTINQEYEARRKDVSNLQTNLYVS